MTDLRIKPAKKKTPEKRRANRTDESSFDRIRMHYFSKDVIELDKRELELAERWENCWLLIGDFNTTTEIIAMMMEEFGLSRRQAYNDLRSAKLLFGDPEDQLTKAHRAISSEWTIKLLKKADEAGDLRSAEKLLLRYNRLHGLDKNTEADFEGMLKKLKPHTIIITGDPKALEAEANDLVADVEDIEAEEVE